MLYWCMWTSAANWTLLIDERSLSDDVSDTKLNESLEDPEAAREVITNVLKDVKSETREKSPAAPFVGFHVFKTPWTIYNAWK